VLPSFKLSAILGARVVVEVIRQLIRSFIGHDSSLYKFGAISLDFLSVVKNEGIGTWVTLRRLKTGPESGPAVPVVFHNLHYPILLRPQTADVETIIDNVVREEYGQFQPASEPQWMIDAGAYIGDTTAYFLSRFPNLRAIALEPNPPSFDIATQNLKPYGERAVLLKQALSGNDDRRAFGGSSIGASVQDTGFEVECTSVPKLLEQFSIGRVNILKMDVEGAEQVVFSSNPEIWLDQVDLLIIEVHGPSIEILISNVLSKNRFAIRHFRSLWYCSREQ
jgi:FkbM family methyltransferase